MFFSTDADNVGLKNMGIMGSTLLDCPFLHGFCHNVRKLQSNVSALFHQFYHLLVSHFRQTLFHDCLVEYVLTKYLSHIYAHTFSPSFPLVLAK